MEKEYIIKEFEDLLNLMKLIRGLKN